MTYHIIWENIGGKLDECWVETQEETTEAVIKMVSGTYLADGDVIRIIEEDTDGR